MGEWGSLAGILSLAFGLGLLHALDADHIIAVSALASRSEPGSGKQRPWQFCMRWALGHGFSLMLMGILVWGIGANLPADFSRYAEAGVGLLLLGMGLWLLLDIRRQSLRLGFHAHAGLPPHAHWHQPDQHDHKPFGVQEHGATLVGALHGVAGAAPLLALIPMVTRQSPAWGFLYLGLFSLGVFCSMLLFGGLLHQLFQRLLRWGNGAMTVVRALLATGSLGAGGYLLYHVS